MKALYKRFFLALLAFVSIGLLPSCQDEDEMEDKIITGVCWEGPLPVKEYYGQENYFSRFFFYDDNYKYGYEEVYYKGVYQETYEFGWYWLEDHSGSYGVIALNYGGRWGADIACIDISKVTNNYIYGYYFMDLGDYWAYKDGTIPSRSENYFELKHVGSSRHQD